jgi:hypothetical protein
LIGTVENALLRYQEEMKGYTPPPIEDEEEDEDENDEEALFQLYQMN